MAATTLIDFNTNPAGTDLYVEPGDTSASWRPDSGVGNSGYLSICDAKGSQRGVLLFKDFEPGLVVKAFTFEFDLRVGGGTDQPADGFSLSFCSNDDPLIANIAAGNGNGWAGTDDEPGAPAGNGLPEEGTTTGLAIGFDTWQSGLINGVRDVAGISIRVNNALIAQFPVPVRPGNVFTPGMPNHDSPWNGDAAAPYVYINDNTTRNVATNGANYLETMTTGARGTNIDINPTPPHTLSIAQVDYGDPSWGEWVKELVWERFKAEVHEDGTVHIFWKGVEITPAGGLQTTFSPIPGRIVLGGRTGGSWADWHVDNISIITVPADTLIIGAPTPNPIGFSINVTDSGPAVLDPAAITMKFDGAAVTPTAVTKSGILSTITFGNAAQPLTIGSVHTVDLTVRDTRGVSATKDGQSFTVAPYITLAPSLAVADVNTSQPGMNVRMHFNPRTDPADPNGTIPLAGYEMESTIARAEQQLYGLRGPNYLTGANAAFTANTINYSFDVNADSTITQQGAFRADAANPGGPNDYPDTAASGIDPASDTTNIAGEMVAYIQFPEAGVYNLIFNSDDGFRTTCDVNPGEVLNSVIIAQADAGKGSSDVIGTVYVPQAGFYPIRTVWFQGGGGSNLEWSGHEVAPNATTRRLLGDTTKTDALKVYRSRTSTGPAAVTFLNPARNSGSPYLGEVKIDVELQDGATPVDQGSIKLNVNGADVTPTITKTGDRTKVSYDPAGNLPSGSTNTVIVTFTAGAQSYAGTNTFTVRNSPVVPASLALAPGSVNTANTGFLITKMVQHGIRRSNADPAGTAEDGMPNSILRADTQLAGLWGWPNTADLSTYTGPGGSYVETTAINYNGLGGDSGYYLGDPGVPGMPGTALAESGIANYSQEILTVLDLQAGLYVMNVNSDDNFAVSIGNPNEWRTIPVRVGMHGANYDTDAGRGNGGGINDGTTFSFEIPQAGLYPFRLVWEQGGGGHNVEWSVREHANAMLMGGKLVNDPTGVKAYQYPLSSAGSPYVKSFSPARSSLATGASPARAGADATVKAVLDQGAGNIDPAGVSLMVDGAAVTPTVTKAGSEVTVSYKPAAGFATGSHAVALTFGDRTVNWTFRVGLPTTPTFWIEAADYNYSGGQTKPEASVMPYAGGAYAGLAGVAGTDYNGPNVVDNPYYRYPATQGVPVSFANDRDRGSGEVVVNYRIGWGGGGQWYNYTRTFPAGRMNVYASMSSGTAGDIIGGRLEDWTSGSATVLGVFNQAATASWGNNDLIPMKDAATTNSVVSVDLAGTKTLRFTLLTGDYNGLLFAPEGVAAPTLTPTYGAGGTLQITYSGGTLVSSDTADGTYAPVAGAVSPYTVDTTAAAARFFQVQGP